MEVSRLVADVRPVMKHFNVVIAVLLTILSNSRNLITLEREKQVIKILGIFGPEDEEERLVFQYAVDEANEDLKRTKWVLKGDIINYMNGDSFNLSQQLCRLLKEADGYSAVFGPDHHELTHVVKSITTTKKIPHIDTRWESTFFNGSDIYINLFPEPKALERAISAVLQDMDWETFTLIYESAEMLVSLQEVLKEKMGRSQYDRPTVIMKMLPRKKDYRPFLKQIKTSSETRIMLHCSPNRIIDILERAKEVGLLQAYQNFFITSLDAHTVDYTKFRTFRPVDSAIGEANITTLRLVNPDRLSNYVHKWNKGSNFFFATKNGESVKTSTALIRDAVLFFTQALKDMPKNFTSSPIDCFSNNVWESGMKLMEKMKSIEYEGLSGRMEFSPSNGSRTFFSLDIIEALRTGGFRILGLWDPYVGVKHRRNQTQILEENTKSLENKTLRVASKIVPPYLIRISNDSDHNDVFEGFCKDLLNELAALLKFNYTLYIPQNNSDPGELVPETGRYTGLIGELTEYRAEMAICDFTITPERKKAVDFTAPFMSLGISILYTVAPAKETSYFSFLDPFDVTVWIYLATAYLGLSIALYIIARCSPYEWESAHPCNQEPEELENPWDLQTCLWLGIGVLLQQGCDILPKGFSARLAVSMWCFFALIMTSTYTANLAAFLTTQRMESPIKSVEDLANQDEVKYGCLKKGATSNFFRTSNDSLYSRMWATMESANPSVFSESNQKGVERVQRSRHKYAFFMESSSIDYEMKLDCDLTKIGNQLDSKFYGIAVPMGSSYREALTTGILQLKENMVIDRLKSKWWRNPENKTCVRVDDQDKDKLGLPNVGGVFLLLILGCTVSFFISVLEFLWNVRKVAVREKILLSEAFWLEMKFAFRLKRSTKPVRHNLPDDTLGKAFSISELEITNKGL